jgi:ABC-type nickel/cobalt efflux system permease component RcnA
VALQFFSKAGIVVQSVDAWIAHFGGSWTLGIVAAILLGLRHATDPDHLTAVSTLLLSERRGGARRAGLLGLSWGVGHATTLFVFGLPVVLFRSYLPPLAQAGAEALIGGIIVWLALRLLVRWRRGRFHAHTHSHGALRHAHPHAHASAHAAHASPEHTHQHADSLGRSPMASFGIGLVHGAGGSAGVGILLVSAVPGRAHGVLALVLFAVATAVSMGLLSMVFGYALARGPLSRRLTPLVPLMGAASLMFGLWYGLSALWGLTPAP